MYFRKFRLYFRKHHPWALFIAGSGVKICIQNPEFFTEEQLQQIINIKMEEASYRS